MSVLSFELAKALKDAGWLQQTGCDMEGEPVWSDDKTKVAYSPSLSELIAACGRNFTLLQMASETEWMCCGYERKEIEAWGSSPQEAVANLWLALRKSETDQE